MLYREPFVWSGGALPEVNKSPGEGMDVDESEPLRLECAHFLESCNKRMAPITDGKEGLRVLQVLNAAQESLEADGDAIAPNRVSTRHAETYYKIYDLSEGQCRRRA